MILSNATKINLLYHFMLDFRISGLVEKTRRSYDYCSDGEPFVCQEMTVK